MNTLTPPPIVSTAAFFGVTPDQIRRQYRKNSATLGNMADRAKRTGKKVNGYTLDQLVVLRDKYSTLANS